MSHCTFDPAHHLAQTYRVRLGEVYRLGLDRTGSQESVAAVFTLLRGSF